MLYKMVKLENKNLLIGIIIVALLIFFIGPKLGLFSIETTDCINTLNNSYFKLNNGTCVSGTYAYLQSEMELTCNQNPTLSGIIYFTSMANCQSNLQTNQTPVCCHSFGLGAGMVPCCHSYNWSTMGECSVPYGFVGGGKEVVSDSFCEDSCCGYTINNGTCVEVPECSTCQESSKLTLTQCQTNLISPPACVKAKGEVFCGKCYYHAPYLWIGGGGCIDVLVFYGLGIVLGLIILFWIFKK